MHTYRVEIIANQNEWGREKEFKGRSASFRFANKQVIKPEVTECFIEQYDADGERVNSFIVNKDLSITEMYG